MASETPKTPPSAPPAAVSEAALAIKNAFIQDYSVGYQSFGLPGLMGKVVGLLLYRGVPLSLDDFTDELQVSKGPVSQIMRRLRDHNLVRRVWVPGSRRDYYEAVPDIFGQAYINHSMLQGQNLSLARKYTALIREDKTALPASFASRMAEMERFYTMMNKHMTNFLTEWKTTKSD